MHITTPADLTDIMWEGELESQLEMQTMRGADVVASIGQPAQWPDGQLMSDKWQRPVGGGRYHLVRFAFSLRPASRATVTEVDFCIRLQNQSGQQAIIYDAFPLSETVEQDRSITLGIGPTFKLGKIDVELAKAETTIDIGRVIPVVIGTGLAEPDFSWRFTAHARQPLIGSRTVVAVVHLPEGLPWTAAFLDLSATVTTRFGPIRVRQPESAWDRLRYVIGS
jgi:hypothetical protein